MRGHEERAENFVRESRREGVREANRRMKVLPQRRGTAEEGEVKLWGGVGCFACTCTPVFASL